MAETYSSNLQSTLIGTGDLSGTWGSVTNTNLGTLLEQAIASYVVQVFTTDANVTLNIVNGQDGNNNTSSTIYSPGSTTVPVSARNMYIECQTSNITTTRYLYLPLNKKLYLIYNNNNAPGTGSGQAIIIAPVSGSGTAITLPAGQRAFIVCDGTNLVLAQTLLAPINNTPIGNLTPSTGVFTSLETTGYIQQGSSGNYYSAIMSTSTGLTNASIAYVTTNGAATTAGQTLGNSDFYGYDGSGYAYAGSIDFNALETMYGGTTWTSTSTPTEIAFNVTTPGSTAPVYVGVVTYTGINNCAIGYTVRSTGAFTTLAASGASTLLGGNTLSGGNTLNGLSTYNADALGTNIEIGFRDIPLSPNTNPVIADRGKFLYVTGNVTVPASTFTAGNAITIVNNSATPITVTFTSGTVYLAGTATTGTARSIAQRGMMTALCTGTNTWYVSGAGVT